MIEKIEVFLFKHLPQNVRMNDDEKYLYLASFLAAAYAVLMNLFLLFFHLITGVLPLFFISLLGFLINSWSFFKLINKRQYLSFGILLSVSVIVNALATAVYIGTDNFVIVYILVTLMMQVLISYASTRVRTIVAAVLWASMVAMVLISHNVTPFRDIGGANTTLAFFNVNLAFFGTIIQLAAGNHIRNLIAKSNQLKLEKSKNEANTDPLTGLLNRRFANTFFKKLSTGQLEQEWCVALLDVDNFKLLNDTYGHRIGDGVLVFISDFLKTNLRKSDLVFRWGGEEFLILLKDVDVPTAFGILDKLRKKLELESPEIHDIVLEVTVTIGVCSLDTNYVEQSIETCDHLMYRGKFSGKNVVVK